MIAARIALESVTTFNAGVASGLVGAMVLFFDVGGWTRHKPPSA